MNEQEKRAEQKLRDLGQRLRKRLAPVWPMHPETEEALRKQFEEETEGDMVKAGKRTPKSR